MHEPKQRKPMKGKNDGSVMAEIELGLHNGDGYELSHVRNHINSELNSDIKVNNRAL